MSEQDYNTQDRIKQAARKVFYEKGYDGTRTRDIAQESGVNLALINYHFKSKEQLFQIIMMETLLLFTNAIAEIINDSQTIFEEKIEKVVAAYSDKFLAEPQIPLFVINQLNKSPEHFFKNLDPSKSIFNSVLYRQFLVQHPTKTNEDFIHFVLNLGGFIVFPFLINPGIKALQAESGNALSAIIRARQKLIPTWLQTILAC